MSIDVKATAAGQLGAARRIVVKVGSALLCGSDGAVRAAWLKTLCADIAALRGRGVETVIVTSGSIALGRGLLGRDGGLSLDEKQAVSAVGQIALAQAWQAAFEPLDMRIGQILLTLDDTENRRRYLNARTTFRTLLTLGATPLVNENDTIATTEIRYGDNDRLAAHVAQITESDLMVILSDIDGLYGADPRRDPSAPHIPLVEEITPEIEHSAKGPNQSAGVGSGGMESKIAAAKIASRNGCATIIAAGAPDNPLQEIADGARATLIKAVGTPQNARRQWIGGRLRAAGRIAVDTGAANALKRGSSLLPAGVIAVTGEFTRGDPVEILDENGVIIGQGLCAYHAAEIEKIAGRRSDEIEAILGNKRRPAVIEKNDLVLHGD